jgi:hypothetical protein
MKAIVLISGIILFLSCNKKRVIHVTGDWEQESSLFKIDPNPDHYFYSFIRLDCDQNFSIERITSNTTATQDSCHAMIYSEYIKGSFEIKKGRLILKGIYTDNNFNEKTTGCFHIGKYEDSFDYSFDDEKLIINEQSVLKKTWDYDCK